MVLAIAPWENGTPTFLPVLPFISSISSLGVRQLTTGGRSSSPAKGQGGRHVLSPRGSRLCYPLQEAAWHLQLPLGDSRLEGGAGLRGTWMPSTTFFFATPRGLWDLSSSTRDRTCIPFSGSTVLNTGPPGKSHGTTFKVLNFWGPWQPGA